MKKFRFPLRPVAVLRAHQELRAKEAFAASVHACTRAEQELATTRTRLKQFEAALTQGRADTFSPTDEAQSLAAYRHECGVEAETEKALRKAQEIVQQKRNEYVEAHRRVEIVSRIEVKARTAHRLEVQREEQAEFDDFASRSVSRRSQKRT